MRFFPRDRRSRSVLSVAITSQLSEYAAATLRRRSGAQIDERFGWQYVGPVINGLGGPDREAIISELWEISSGASDLFTASTGLSRLTYRALTPQPRYAIWQSARTSFWH